MCRCTGSSRGWKARCEAQATTGGFGSVSHVVPGLQAGDWRTPPFGPDTPIDVSTRLRSRNSGLHSRSRIARNTASCRLPNFSATSSKGGYRTAPRVTLRAKKQKARREPSFCLSTSNTYIVTLGGEGGIRTHGTLKTYTGFRVRRIRPLCHLSVIRSKLSTIPNFGPLWPHPLARVRHFRLWRITAHPMLARTPAHRVAFTFQNPLGGPDDEQP